MFRSASQVGSQVNYNPAMRLYDIQLDSDHGRLLFIGCTGGEVDPKVLFDLFTTGQWNAERDTRGQVAAGMGLVVNQKDKQTIVVLGGDQVYPDGVPEDQKKAQSVLNDEIFSVYGAMKASIFLVNGNHEVGGHGKKQKDRALLDQKAQRHVDMINLANQPHF